MRRAEDKMQKENIKCARQKIKCSSKSKDKIDLQFNIKNKYIQQEPHFKSLLKAITWRITGTIDTFFISFIITHDVKKASLIGSIEIVTKIILYYFPPGCFEYLTNNNIFHIL